MKPLPPEQQAAQAARALKRITEEMQSPVYFERNAVLALDRYHRFQAHIKVGFTEQQALELCK